MTNVYFSKRKPAKCPKCGSAKVARILYGYPHMSEDLERDMNEGKIVLGGCCEESIDPSWQCTACDTPIYNESLRELFEAQG
jgi:hypothetical protein